jgi:WbqC-like protein family
MVLPAHIFPSVAWFLEAAKHGSATVGMGGYYEKQTNKSRYAIAGPNNLQNLIVPVLHTGAKKLLTDTMVSNQERWDRMHTKALLSVYGKAPFFEFYDYRILPILNHNHSNLSELIKQSIVVLHRNLIPEIPLFFSDDIGLDIESSEIAPYPQVFDDKMGFRGEVSALDLLFNLGPEAEEYLMNGKM